MASFSFPKTEKLCKLKEIEALFSSGKSVTAFPLKMIFLPFENSYCAENQVLMSVPKRNFKKAVHRNRIKRLLRESYRLNKQLLTENTTQKFAISFIFIGKELPDYQSVTKKMLVCFEKFFSELDLNKKSQ